MRQKKQRISQRIVSSIVLVGVLLLASCASLIQRPYTTFVTYAPIAPVELPGFEWKEELCIDFTMYSYTPQATEESPLSQGVGMYLGGHPNFEKHATDVREYRKFAGRYSTWYSRIETQDGKPMYVWETLAKIHQKPHYYPTYAHVWVYANEESEVLELVKWTSTLQFTVIDEEVFE